jgi:hypothetical protein
VKNKKKTTFVKNNENKLKKKGYFLKPGMFKVQFISTTKVKKGGG